MHRSIDYYFSLVSPWAYIGHATFMNLTLTYLGADLEGLDAQPGTPVDGGPTISTAHQI